METSYKPKFAWMIDRLVAVIIIVIIGTTTALKMPGVYFSLISVATALVAVFSMVIIGEITNGSEDSKILNTIKTLLNKFRKYKKDASC